MQKCSPTLINLSLIPNKELHRRDGGSLIPAFITIKTTRPQNKTFCTRTQTITLGDYYIVQHFYIFILLLFLAFSWALQEMWWRVRHFWKFETFLKASRSYSFCHREWHPWFEFIGSELEIIFFKLSNHTTIPRPRCESSRLSINIKLYVAVVSNKALINIHKQVDIQFLSLWLTNEVQDLQWLYILPLLRIVFHDEIGLNNT